MDPDDPLSLLDAVGDVALCRLEELPDGGARGFVLPDTGGGVLRLILLRSGDAVSGFRNRCPHRGTPLDLRPDDFLDRDGRHLVCATHGALFRREDGFCVAGPCAGDRLEPVPLRVERGVVLAATGLLPDVDD